MFHDFLSYIFGIVLLCLSLVPEASHTCEEQKIKLQYQDFLIHDILLLENITIQADPRCNLNNNIRYRCNETEEIPSILNMAHLLQTRSCKCNISSELKNHLTNVSDMTFKILKACCNHAPQTKEGPTCLGRKSCSLCRIRKLVSDFRLYWNQFYRHSNVNLCKPP